MNTLSKPSRVRIAEAGDSIRRREAFVAGDGSLSGGHQSHAYPSTGRMPATHSPALLLAMDHAVMAGDSLYVVRSYGTPIAWAGPGEALTVPDVRYSATMSRHQGIARRADDSLTRPIA